MKFDKIALREVYYNRITNLQHKKRDKKDQFLLLSLLLVYVMEYLTNGNKQVIAIKAPFLLQMDITKPSRFMCQVDEALNFRGNLAEPLNRFKQAHTRELDTLTTIVPPHPLVVDKKNAYKKALEKTDSLEQNNLVQVSVNAMVLNKKHKKWNTQRDSKVRKTEFHSGIDEQEVAIMDYFSVGAFEARYPADSMLPPFDRLNCRCYMTFR